MVVSWDPLGPCLEIRGQLAAVEAYLIFTVWSLCEDMKADVGSGRV